jgi:hypothetical protein
MSLFYSVRHGPDLKAQIGEATPGRGTALQKLLVIKLAPRARGLPLPLFTRLPRRGVLRTSVAWLFVRFPLYCSWYKYCCRKCTFEWEVKTDGQRSLI